MVIPKLSSDFQPKIVTINLPFKSSLIQKTEGELGLHAQRDDDKCYGYFPGMGDRRGIDANLPVSQSFADGAQYLTVDGKKLNFNFLRLSLIDQPSISPFHLDSDSATALTGDVATMSQRLVWRLLINLSPVRSRTVIYLDLDPSSVELINDRGYISYPSKSITDDMIKKVELSPRSGSEVSAVLFCASRVLHAGKDINGGHFVAGYGVDEKAVY